MEELKNYVMGIDPYDMEEDTQCKQSPEDPTKEADFSAQKEKIGFGPTHTLAFRADVKDNKFYRSGTLEEVTSSIYNISCNDRLDELTLGEKVQLINQQKVLMNISYMLNVVAAHSIG